MLSVDTAFKAQVHLETVLGRNAKAVIADCRDLIKAVSSSNSDVCEAVQHETSPLTDEQLTQYDTLESNNMKKCI